MMFLYNFRTIPTILLFIFFISKSDYSNSPKCETNKQTNTLKHMFS